MLADHGVDCFFSEKSIKGAQQWHDEIGAALKRCDWFLVVLSPHAVGSRWVKHEIIYALQAERYVGRIVPVLIGDCDLDRLSWTLPGLQMVDFRKDFHRGCRDLMAIWRMDYSRKAEERHRRSAR